MTIVRWDPFRVNSLLQYSARNQGGENKSSTGTSFIPLVDVYEDEHKIVLNLEVPGVKQDDLDIRLENNMLTVRGERKFENEENAQNFHRIERRYGSFVRNFSLPTSVDSENVKASYDSGVLKLELNKRAEAKPKQIKIGVGSATAEAATVAA
jgi:HSP20 family protein